VRVTFKTRTICSGCIKYANPQNGFKQTDFLRSVPPIFLTLTSQGGNQGIAEGDSKKKEIRLREIQFCRITKNKPPPTFSVAPILSTSRMCNIVARKQKSH